MKYISSKKQILRYNLSKYIHLKNKIKIKKTLVYPYRISFFYKFIFFNNLYIIERYLNFKSYLKPKIEYKRFFIKNELKMNSFFIKNELKINSPFYLLRETIVKEIKEEEDYLYNIFSFSKKKRYKFKAGYHRRYLGKKYSFNYLNISRIDSNSLIIVKKPPVIFYNLLQAENKIKKKRKKSWKYKLKYYKASFFSSLIFILSKNDIKKFNIIKDFKFFFKKRVLKYIIVFSIFFYYYYKFL